LPLSRLLLGRPLRALHALVGLVALALHVLSRLGTQSLCAFTIAGTFVTQCMQCLVPHALVGSIYVHHVVDSENCF
jgi:hypothetical protein